MPLDHEVYSVQKSDEFHALCLPCLFFSFIISNTPRRSFVRYGAYFLPTTKPGASQFLGCTSTGQSPVWCVLPRSLPVTFTNQMTAGTDGMFGTPTWYVFWTNQHVDHHLNSFFRRSKKNSIVPHDVLLFWTNFFFIFFFLKKIKNFCFYKRDNVPWSLLDTISLALGQVSWRIWGMGSQWIVDTMFLMTAGDSI